MSLWDELLPQLTKISSDCSSNIQQTLDFGLAAIDEFMKDSLSGRLRIQDKRDPAKLLLSINEDQDDANTPPSSKAPPPNQKEDYSKQASNKKQEYSSKRASYKTPEDSVKPASNKTQEDSSNLASNKTQEDSSKPASNKTQDDSSKLASNKSQQQDTRKKVVNKPSEQETASHPEADLDQVAEKPQKATADPSTNKKRSKDALGNNTPEQDKRHKRNASVRAQGIISKQVNVNLSAKLRRPENDKEQEQEQPRSDDNKENRTHNAPIVLVKQEKVSILPEEPLPEPSEAPATSMQVQVKLEHCDFSMMPPPSLPAPSSKTRKGREKKKPEVETEDKQESETSDQGIRRSTRCKKTDALAVPHQTRASTRASSRRTRQDSEASQDDEMPPPPPPEPRPKRTRAKKQAQPEVTSESDSEKSSEPAVDTNEKPRPKRTRRRKASATKEDEHKEEEKTQSPPCPEMSQSSPIISAPAKKLKKAPLERVKDQHCKEECSSLEKETGSRVEAIEQDQVVHLEEAQTITPDNESVKDQTIVIPNHAEEPKSGTETPINMNETMILETGNTERGTIVLCKGPALNETVVIATNGVNDQMTNDESLLTDDNTDEIEDTPPRSMIPVKQPASAVKERVQQFEQMANGGGGGSGGLRLTRTKTRALAKQSADAENVSPREQQHSALTAANLAKFNGMSAGKNGINSQVTLSASKPRNNIVNTVKSFLPQSATKATAPATARLEESRQDRECARKKKEALLEAKREEQRRRREQKMAAAAAARDAQARSRQAQLEAKAQGWQEKQALVDQGKLEKLKEAERRRVALEKKAAETEERRRAEEAARQARLEEEQRRAEAARRKMQEEAERVKKEELQMEREIQQARQLYHEKEKERLKQLTQKRMETPATPGGGGTPIKQPPPVHMADGFQFLCSDDEEDEKPKRPQAEWNQHKPRKLRLFLQDQIKRSYIYKLFTVQKSTPDLREVFPGIDRRNLKRTSSAVWRTPPRLPHLLENE